MHRWPAGPCFFLDTENERVSLQKSTGRSIFTLLSVLGVLNMLDVLSVPKDVPLALSFYA